MDQSIFSLFTTKDWPFQAINNPSSSSSNENGSENSKQKRTTNKSKTSSANSKSLRNRTDTVDNLLFFDRLMILGSISDYSELFPPPHPSRLRQLLDSIDGCPFDLLKKNCLVYYLLKEYNDGREEQFAIDSLIPSHFKRGLDGLWELDHSQWKSAIRSLADPTVTPDFLPEIIRTLATQPSRQLRSDLVLQFYKLSQPVLDLESTGLVIRAMCVRRQLSTAWALQRSFPRPERSRLIQTVLECCFGVNEFRRPLSESLPILIGFPFDETEDAILYRFAINASKVLIEPHAMVVVHFYLNKLTSQARYIEAIRFERELSESGRIKSDPDIDRVIKGITHLLPEVQLNMLEIEIDHHQPQLPVPDKQYKGRSTSDNNNSVNRSAEDLSASYDLCALAWDTPEPPPELPPPASLAEARDQQGLLSKPKPPTARHSLPLSASPMLRRTLPRTPLSKSNEPQKVLLKALAHHIHPNSVTQSPVINSSTQSSSGPSTQAGETSEPALAPQTPRFTHFVSPARLPPSSSKPLSPPKSSTRPRASLPASGSPFHHHTAITQDRPPSSAEDRWPTRIAFTPRRPSQKTIQKHVVPKNKGPIQTTRETPKAMSDSSSETSPVAAPPKPVSKKAQFEAVVVPRVDNSQRNKSPPKKIARLNKSPKARKTVRVLPGGLDEIDEEMHEVNNENEEEKIPRIRQSTTSSSKNSTRNSKKMRVENSHHRKDQQQQPPPATPRRSTRLQIITPSKGIDENHKDGRLDHDDDDDDDDDDGNDDREEDSIDLLKSNKNGRGRKKSVR